MNSAELAIAKQKARRANTIDAWEKLAKRCAEAFLYDEEKECLDMVKDLKALRLELKLQKLETK